MADALKKAERLEKIAALLCHAPRGLTTADLARHWSSPTSWAGKSI